MTVVGMLVAFSWFLLWQATIAAPLVWQDSKVYEQVAKSPLWSSGFWFGARPPLAPLLWKLTGSPEGFVMVQTLISALAWGFLVLTVARVVRRGLVRMASAFVILAFGSTLAVTLWNRSVLSETLAIAAAVTFCATLVRLCCEPSLRHAVGVTAAALAAALTRDANIAIPAFAVTIGILVLGYLLCRRDRPRWFGVAGAATLGLALVTAFAILGVHRSSREDQTVADVYYVRVFPYPARVAWFGSHGMPEESRIENLPESPTTPGAAPVVAPDLDSSTFHDLDRWMTTRGVATYEFWILTHPWLAISEPLASPQLAYNFANGDLYFYAAANRTTSGLSPVLWPPWPWFVGLLGVALAAGTIKHRWRDPAFLAACLLAVGGAFTALVAWNTDGQEVTRHTVDGLVMGRLAVWLAIVVALGSATPGRPLRTRQR